MAAVIACDQLCVRACVKKPLHTNKPIIRVHAQTLSYHYFGPLFIQATIAMGMSISGALFVV